MIEPFRHKWLIQKKIAKHDSNHHAFLLSFIMLFLLSIVSPVRAETSWKVGAASVAMAAEDSMVIGGGIGPGFVQGQEGLLQATAIVIRSDKQLCLISA